MFSCAVPVLKTRGHQEDLIEVMRVGSDLSTPVYRLQIYFTISLFNMGFGLQVPGSVSCILKPESEQPFLLGRVLSSRPSIVAFGAIDKACSYLCLQIARPRFF